MAKLCSPLVLEPVNNSLLNSNRSPIAPRFSESGRSHNFFHASSPAPSPAPNASPSRAPLHPVVPPALHVSMIFKTSVFILFWEAGSPNTSSRDFPESPIIALTSLSQTCWPIPSEEGQIVQLG